MFRRWMLGLLASGLALWPVACTPAQSVVEAPATVLVDTPTSAPTAAPATAIPAQAATVAPAPTSAASPTGAASVSGIITITAPVTVTAPNGAILDRYALAGTGATVNGKRVNWTGVPQADGALPALVGEVSLTDVGWSIEQTTLTRAGEGWTAASTGTVLVQGIELADGSSCWFAGHGATFGFQDQRANFTCGDRQAKEITALFGELKARQGGYEILRATGSLGEQGFTATNSGMVGVAALYIGPAE